MNPARKKPLELSHHLGNVRSVIADVKLNESLAGGGMETRAEILMSSDYYPFGMTIGETHVESEGYRYGFQGQEEDDETGLFNYKYRMHDPRLGRFFAVDPLTKTYPHYTPYSFSGNKLIAFVELEGLEEIYYYEQFQNENAAIQIFNANEIGKDLIETFQDPSLNEGWDILFFVDNDNIIGNPDGATRGYAFSQKKGDGIDKLEKKFAAYFERLGTNPEKKGLIIIGIPSNKVNDANGPAAEGEWQPAGDLAHTIMHEVRIHAIPIMLGTSQPQEVEHGNYHRNPGGLTFGVWKYSPAKSIIREHYPKSPAGIDLASIDLTVDLFHARGAVYMQKMKSKQVTQISNSIPKREIKL